MQKCLWSLVFLNNLVNQFKTFINQSLFIILFMSDTFTPPNPEQQDIKDTPNFTPYRLTKKTTSQLPALSNSINLLKCDQGKKKSKLVDNKHLKYLYHKFCQQIYSGGNRRTFDHIAQSANIMPVNKWMIFCRQFEFANQIKKRVLLQIYRSIVPDPKQTMLFNTFVQGLQLVKQKANISEAMLIKDILCVSSRQSVRERLKNLKTQFDGPQKNFFIQAQLTQRDKEEVKRVEKKHRYVLHQGMSLEHIQKQMKLRKKMRQQKKMNLINSSLIERTSFLRKDNNSPLQKNTYRRKKNNFFDSYSQMFQEKKQKEKIVAEIKSNMRKLKEEKTVSIQRPQKQLEFDIDMTETEKASEIFFQTQVQEQHHNKKKTELETEVVNELKIEELVSDSEDEILEEHFKIEKKLNN